MSGGDSAVRDLGRCWDSVGCRRRAGEEYREIMIEQFSTWNLDIISM